MDRIPKTDFDERVINFWDTDIQEMYNECGDELNKKIADQNAKMAEQDIKA
jgi:hypothetical protein